MLELLIVFGLAAIGIFFTTTTNEPEADTASRGFADGFEDDGGGIGILGIDIARKVRRARGAVEQTVATEPAEAPQRTAGAGGRRGRLAAEVEARARAAGRDTTPAVPADSRFGDALDDEADAAPGGAGTEDDFKAAVRAAVADSVAGADDDLPGGDDVITGGMSDDRLDPAARAEAPDTAATGLRATRERPAPPRARTDALPETDDYMDREVEAFEDDDDIAGLGGPDAPGDRLRPETAREPRTDLSGLRAERGVDAAPRTRPLGGARAGEGRAAPSARPARSCMAVDHADPAEARRAAATAATESVTPRRPARRTADANEARRPAADTSDTRRQPAEETRRPSAPATPAAARLPERTPAQTPAAARTAADPAPARAPAPAPDRKPAHAETPGNDMAEHDMPPVIEDFDPAEDQIVIGYRPGEAGDGRIGISEDPRHPGTARVTLGGRVVALVPGGFGLVRAHHIELFMLDEAA